MTTHKTTRHETLVFSHLALSLPWKYVYAIDQDMNVGSEVQTLKEYCKLAGSHLLGNQHGSQNGHWIPKVIFDVGTWNGDNSVQFYENFPNAKIIAFEANPSIATQTRQKCQRYASRLSVVDLAMSDHDGTITFYASKSCPEFAKAHNGFQATYSGSTLKPDREKAVKLWNHQVDFDTTGFQVKCTTLISFCEKSNISDIDILHIDVQGAESLVIKGLGNLRPRVIIAETGNIESLVYQGANKPSELDQQLFALGYKVFRIFKNDTVYAFCGDSSPLDRDLTYQKLTNDLWKDFHGPYYESVTGAELFCIHNYLACEWKPNCENQQKYNVAELGPGLDVFTNYIVKHLDPQPLLVDFNQVYLDMSKQMYPSCSILNYDLNQSLDIWGDLRKTNGVHRTDNAIGSYDIIFVCGIAYHLSQIEKLIDSCKFLLNSNGIIIWTSYHDTQDKTKRPFYNVPATEASSSVSKTLACRYTQDYLTNLLVSNGFQVKKPKQVPSHPDYQSGLRSIVFATRIPSLNIKPTKEFKDVKDLGDNVVKNVKQNHGTKLPVVDIFIKTSVKDYKWLPYMIQSVQKKCQSSIFRGIVIVSDEDEKNGDVETLQSLKLNLLTDFKIKHVNNVVMPELSNVFASEPEYIWQQIVKMQWHLYSDADYAFCIDPVTIVTKDLSLDDLFVTTVDRVGIKRYQPKWYIESWNSERVKQCGSQIWKPMLDYTFNTTTQYEAMCQPAVLLSRRLCIEFQNMIHSKFSQSLQQFMFESPHPVSEYNLLGTFAMMLSAISSETKSPETQQQQQWILTPFNNNSKTEYYFVPFVKGQTEWATAYNSRDPNVAKIQAEMENLLKR